MRRWQRMLMTWYRFSFCEPLRTWKQETSFYECLHLCTSLLPSCVLWRLQESDGPVVLKISESQYVIWWYPNNTVMNTNWWCYFGNDMSVLAAPRMTLTELPRRDWARQGIFLDWWQCFVGFGTYGRSGQRWGKQMVAIYQDCLEICIHFHYTDSSCWDISKKWRQKGIGNRTYWYDLTCRYSQYIHFLLLS